MSKKLLSFDRSSGLSTYWSKDKTTGKTIIESVQDVEPLFEMNKFKSQFHNKKNDYWYVGTIPDVICQAWSKECGHKVYSQEWNEYVFKKLNLPEFSKFNQNRIKL